jgi:hypothetical protein
MDYANKQNLSKDFTQLHIARVFHQKQTNSISRRVIVRRRATSCSCCAEISCSTSTIAYLAVNERGCHFFYIYFATLFL